MSEAQHKANSPSPKKSAKEKDAKKTVGKTHPPTAAMVAAAINHLNEKSGSSINAIKKYIAVTYNIDAEKQATYIKKYVKNAVMSGELVQTSGQGASGSFRFPTKSDKAKMKAAELEMADKDEEAPVKSKKEKPRKAEPASPKKQKTETKKGSRSKSPKADAPKMKKSEKSPTKLKPPKVKKADKPTSPKKTAAKSKTKK